MPEHCASHFISPIKTEGESFFSIVWIASKDKNLKMTDKN